jgi:hypothetical protein
MAKFEQKDNSGSLFKNERREKDTHPHATGSATIAGVEYWVSAWTKEGKNGKFQSLAFKVKVEKDRAGTTQYNAGRLEEGDVPESDIPF